MRTPHFYPLSHSQNVVQVKIVRSFEAPTNPRKGCSNPVYFSPCGHVTFDLEAWDCMLDKNRKMNDRRNVTVQSTSTSMSTSMLTSRSSSPLTSSSSSSWSSTTSTSTGPTICRSSSRYRVCEGCGPDGRFRNKPFCPYCGRRQALEMD